MLTRHQRFSVGQLVIHTMWDWLCILLLGHNFGLVWSIFTGSQMMVGDGDVSGSQMLVRFHI